jgi:hypothetical protein
MEARVFRWIGFRGRGLGSLVLFLFVLSACVSFAARSKDKISYGEGLIVNIALPEAEVEQVVEDVAANGVIRGTKEYNKDEFVAGAKIADTSSVFPEWTEGGKIIYKVRAQAIDPRNFKDGGDVGTLAVRYVIKPQGEKNTILRIDALFEEDFRRTVHPSNGSVESSEYKDIREHLDTIELMKRQDAEAQAERQERLNKKLGVAAQSSSSKGDSSSSTAMEQPVPPPAENHAGSESSMRVEVPVAAQEQTAVSSSSISSPPIDQTPEQRLESLRKQVERLVKSPGAPLKSAPFHTASTLQLLSTGTEVLIVISTPYWYGVETHEGQHGWVMRDQVEAP